MATRSSFNPATMAMEAHCADCGALVATMTRGAQVAHPLPGLYWLGLELAGRANHREACRGHGAE